MLRNPIHLLDACSFILGVILFLSLLASLFHRSSSISFASCDGFSFNASLKRLQWHGSWSTPDARSAGDKRRRTEHGDRRKATRRSTKKQKFQSLLERTDQFFVSKLLLPWYIDLEDQQLCSIFPRLLKIFVRSLILMMKNYKLWKFKRYIIF